MYRNLQKQEQYTTNLSGSIKDALEWYTGGNFDKFNIALRTNKILPSSSQRILNYIDDAFDAVPPISEPVVVYKGKGSNRVYSDKAFMSTTLDYNKTKRFSGKNCCVIQITVSPGSKILPLRTISREPDEEEVLLDRNGYLLVTGSKINDQDKMKIIFATYSPEESKLVKNDEQIKKAEKAFDSDLIIERIIKFYEGEDTDFIDEDDIAILFKKITKQNIPSKVLTVIKSRLNIE